MTALPPDLRTLNCGKMNEVRASLTAQQWAFCLEEVCPKAHKFTIFIFNGKSYHNQFKEGRLYL